MAMLSTSYRIARQMRDTVPVEIGFCVILHSVLSPDFSVPHTRNAFGYLPSPANYARSRARPLSSISPVMIAHRENGSLHTVLGSSGGSRIISTTIQGILHLLTENMTMAQSLQRPRLHDQLIPNEVSIESSDSWDEGLEISLEARGHVINHNQTFGSSGQGIRVQYGPNLIFEAAAEPRQKDSGVSVV